jgi:hypothetical protein
LWFLQRIQHHCSDIFILPWDAQDKLSDINHQFNPLRSGVNPNLFYAAKNRKGPALVDPHTSMDLPRKT